MIYITQLIYIHDTGADAFNQFEALVIPMIQKYNGQLLLRMRPTPGEVIELNIEVPYELHLISFETDDDFENYKMDKNRESFLHLKNRSVKSVLLIKGVAI